MKLITIHTGLDAAPETWMVLAVQDEEVEAAVARLEAANHAGQAQIVVEDGPTLDEAIELLGDLNQQ